MNQITNEFKQKTSGNGLRVFLVTLLLLIALIVANVLVALLPTSVTELDMSADKMYSVSDTTKRALSKLDTPVELYYLVAGGEESLVNEALHIKLFLSKLPSYTGKLKFKIIDTVENPTYAGNLGVTEDTPNNSIVIKSDKRTRVLTTDDLFYYYIDGIGKLTAAEAQQYVYTLQMYGQNVTPTYHFDGEGQLLGAIDFVTTDVLPKIYTLDGHSETALPTALTDALIQQNMAIDTLSLIKTGSVPEDCDLLIIHTLRADLSMTETEAISTYLANGGKLMIITSPGIAVCENLLSLAEKYGLFAEDGIVIEGNSGNYYQVPYYIFPDVTSHPITGGYESTTYIMMPYAHGIRVNEQLPDGVNVTGIFSSSTASYIVPTDAETTARPEGQENASHLIGALAEAQNGSALFWATSYGIADEASNSYTANGNFMYFLSAVKYLTGATENISTLAPMTLTTPRLTVSAASVAIWSFVLIILIPLVIFVCGLAYWMKRRKK